MNNLNIDLIRFVQRTADNTLNNLKEYINEGVIDSSDHVNDAMDKIRIYRNKITAVKKINSQK